MAVSFGNADQFNSVLSQLGQIGQRGTYTPQMKLPAIKPQSVLQPFAGLGSVPSANSHVTAGIGAVPGNLGRLMSAIRGQESGGNYTAHNPSGASGAYQILASNIPSWSREALGHSVSYSQFMGSPQIQDAIARYKLGQYLKTRGMAGAAATWYGGDYGYHHMYDKKPQNGYPSIYDYVMSVINRAK